MLKEGASLEEPTAEVIVEQSGALKREFAANWGVRCLSYRSYILQLQG